MTDPDLHPGYAGIFTRDQCPFAKYPNGTRIKKILSEPGDGNSVGTFGTVLGSIGHPDVGVGYFVEWDTFPRYAVWVSEGKLGLASRQT